ncbi:MAG: methylated-DNA--[protein]-cysteine S-methyltransferase [Gaiellaceae bacterium MAG52_C11]|nr:methylated-DNA--[protein]-cysteine S-methyltransferase [Candidatus Gaiellasilicea maunaloa]
MRVTRVPYAVDGWGMGELWLGDGRIVLAHDAPTAPTPQRGARKPPSGIVSSELSRNGDAFVSDLVRRIHSYFAGEPVAFADVELDLEWCTSFQRDLADALRAVPWGEVVAYGELAERAGYPRAGRAAGSFCAANTFFLLVPCHRVVAADGIGSYGASGVGLKRRLLRLEGREDAAL